MGIPEGAKVGPYSDVFGFGRTCYFALLRVPDPDDEEKRLLPVDWTNLLALCTSRTIERRLQDFSVALIGLLM